MENATATNSFHNAISISARVSRILRLDGLHPVVHGAKGCSQKSFKLMPAAPIRVSSQRLLTQSVTSVMSVANDKGNNEIILGAVHRPLSICLTAEENPRKPQLGNRLMKGLCNQLLPRMGSLFSN